MTVPVQISAGLRARKVELAHHEIRRFLVGHLPGLGFDVDNYAKRAPKAIFEHDKPVFFAFEKTLLLHQLLAVERPALVEDRRLVHQARQGGCCGNGVGNGKLEMMSRIAFVNRGVLESNPVMLSEQIVIGYRRDIVIADLIGIFWATETDMPQRESRGSEIPVYGPRAALPSGERDELRFFFTNSRAASMARS